MYDRDYMELALTLAAKGRGQVSPNPMVGAVIVRDGQIVGRGYHTFAEKKHAEVWAFERAGDRAKGATLFVTLEPCSHHGRTPPCAEAVIAAGIKRVVAAIEDPNPLVAGQGFARLRAAGIEVEVGLSAGEATYLNEKFIAFQRTGRPFVHLKTAQSLDGKIATRTKASKWITGPEARAAVQELRYESDAILVGIGTVLADNPDLTMRLDRPRSRPLVRIVLDERLQLPTDSRLVQTAKDTPLLVFTISNDSKKVDSLINSGTTVLSVAEKAQKIDLREMLTELAKRDITSLLVEGGSETNGRFVAERLVDKFTFYVAPKIIGGKSAPASIGGDGIVALDDALLFESFNFRMVGQDMEFTAYPLRGNKTEE